MNTTLASTITKTASKQTYYTIRCLADRSRIEDAYRSYAYFRWVDDILDAESISVADRDKFIQQQKSLLDSCYHGEIPQNTSDQEKMLVELIQNDREMNSGLQSYLRNMMLVMDFDAKRRGGLISQSELHEYSHWLAMAVTDNLHHFIGHGEFAPYDETRYLAVTAAHITHMLRDTFDDLQAGYYNIPQEVLDANHIKPQDIHSDAYRSWVKMRVQLAREYFEAGRSYFSKVRNARCRLACFAYIAQFDWLLDIFEREEYYLRPSYANEKNAMTGIRMGINAMSSTLKLNGAGGHSQQVASHRLGKL